MPVDTSTTQNSTQNLSLLPNNLLLSANNLNTTTNNNGFILNTNYNHFKFTPLLLSPTAAAAAAATTTSTSSSSSPSLSTSSTSSPVNLSSMNAFTIGLEAKQEFATLTNIPSVFSYKIPHYKSFVNKTDESLNETVKTIETLKETFKIIQSNANENFIIQAQLYEPLRKLSKQFSDNDLQMLYNKFIELGKSLNDNLRIFINEINSKTFQPLEQLAKINFENEKSSNLIKKNFEKSMKLYESKCNSVTKDKTKQAKENKSEILVDQIIEEAYEEKCTLALKLCEYLLSVNEVKTQTCDEFTNSLTNYFKAQLEYFHQSFQLIANYTSYFNKLEQNINSFKKKQEQEKEQLIETINTISIAIKQQISNNQSKSSSNNSLSVNSVNNTNNSNEENLSVNGHNNNNNINMSSLTLSVSNNSLNSSPSSILRKNPAIDGSVYQLHQMQTNKSFGTTKTGYLLKHSLRNRMRKHWLKRKCVVENGCFLIYHSDENKDPVRLKLITCQVKLIENKRFKVFSGSNSRVYDFMADSDNECKEWISVLNNSKSESLEKAFSNEYVDESMKQLINNILKKVKKLEGNDRCCDCSAPDPEWVVTNLGILTCIECCGIHRELGVQISKTQSIKIDRLSTSQLIIARMIGNSKFNQIFEAILDKSQKLQPNNNMETRRKYIRLKYENHKFVTNQLNNEDVNNLVKTVKESDHKKLFDILLQLFGQNYDLLSPVDADEKKRNILQLAIVYIEDANHIHIIDFIVQNRDFFHNYSINYQDNDGNTALHHCALNNRVESTKILLKANIDHNIRNKDGFTAYEIASRLMHFDLTKQIRQLINGNKVDDVEWIGLFDEDYLSDTVDDNDYATHRTRPMSMISFSNFMSPSSFSIAEEVDFKDSALNINGSNLNGNVKSNHQRQPSDPTILNENKLPSVNNEASDDASMSVYNVSFDPTQETNKISSLASNSSANLVTDSQKRNRFSLISNSTMNLNGQNYKQNSMTNSTVTLLSQQPLQQPQQPKQEQQQLRGLSFKKINENLLRCKAVKTYQTAQPNHLSFDVNDTIIITNNSNKDFWHGYLETNSERRGLFPPSYVNVYV